MVIIFNVVLGVVETIAFERGNESETFQSIISAGEFMFTIIYTIEMLSKIAISGWPQYWARYTNRFDFLITVSTIILQFLTDYLNLGDNSVSKK